MKSSLNSTYPKIFGKITIFFQIHWSLQVLVRAEIENWRLASKSKSERRNWKGLLNYFEAWLTGCVHKLDTPISMVSVLDTVISMAHILENPCPPHHVITAWHELLHRVSTKISRFFNWNVFIIIGMAQLCGAHLQHACTACMYSTHAQHTYKICFFNDDPTYLYL